MASMTREMWCEVMGFASTADLQKHAHVRPVSVVTAQAAADAAEERQPGWVSDRAVPMTAVDQLNVARLLRLKQIKRASPKTMSTLWAVGAAALESVARRMAQLQQEGGAPTVDTACAACAEVLNADVRGLAEFAGRYGVGDVEFEPRIRSRVGPPSVVWVPPVLPFERVQVHRDPLRERAAQVREFESFLKKHYAHDGSALGTTDGCGGVGGEK